MKDTRYGFWCESCHAVLTIDKEGQVCEGYKDYPYECPLCGEHPRADLHRGKTLRCGDCKVGLVVNDDYTVRLKKTKSKVGTRWVSISGKRWCRGALRGRKYCVFKGSKLNDKDTCLIAEPIQPLADSYRRHMKEKPRFKWPKNEKGSLTLVVGDYWTAGGGRVECSTNKPQKVMGLEATCTSKLEKGFRGRVLRQRRYVWPESIKFVYKKREESKA